MEQATFAAGLTKAAWQPSYQEPLDSKVAPILRLAFADNFARQESEDGERWQPHAPRTVKMHGPHPLLILTGRMHAAMVSISPDSVKRVTGDSLELGTNAEYRGFPYPVVHQEGGGNIPQREFCYAREDVLNKIDEVILDVTERRLP